MQIEREGKTITVYTQDELNAEVKGLQVTNENLKAEKKELADKVRHAKEQVRELEEAKAKAEGDNETLRRIAEEREAEKRQAVEDERKKFSDLLNMTKKEKVENFITSLLEEVKPADATRAKHLRKLLKADFEFDVDLEKNEFTVRGENVTSAEELKRLIMEGEEYEYYLADSGATGGGATGGKPSGAGKKWSEMSEKERLQLKQDNPAEFYRNLKGA
jgi:flagellar biosynthesis GTPase FlhF